jgi:hypothetical protein
MVSYHYNLLERRNHVLMGRREVGCVLRAATRLSGMAFPKVDVTSLHTDQADACRGDDEEGHWKIMVQL